ncbi:hypothetical protein D9M71_740250 [compost metagenome]
MFIAITGRNDRMVTATTTVPSCGTKLAPTRLSATSASVACRCSASQPPTAIIHAPERDAPRNTAVISLPLEVFFGR